MSRRSKWIFIAMLAVPPLGLLVVALSYPFLAVNDPSGARIAVVEGWIPEDHLPEVKRTIDSLGYDHVYVTGTVRNFSYTLRIRDTLVVELDTEVVGELIINTCGSDHCGFVIGDVEGIVLQDSVQGSCREYATTLKRPTTRLWITPNFNGIPRPEWELIYIAYVTVNGNNLHALQRSTAIHRQDGSMDEGTPTFADLAARGLHQAGMDRSRIITLRTLNAGESRTWANAKLFALRASRDGVDAVDVISFGIHARRSRVTYQTACGKGVKVGVVSIPDPEVGRGVWWRSMKGWIKVLKELGGVPASYLVDRMDQ